jgi:hypothetical protein
MTLLQVASVIRESGKTFRNPSGTADRLAGSFGIGLPLQELLVLLLVILCLLSRICL